MRQRETGRRREKVFRWPTSRGLTPGYGDPWWEGRDALPGGDQRQWCRSSLAGRVLLVSRRCRWPMDRDGEVLGTAPQQIGGSMEESSVAGASHPHSCDDDEGKDEVTSCE